MLNLSQKERSLLNDQKSHEELCIKKYGNYAQQAQDQELKNIFMQLQQQEYQHLDTINQILSGQVPNMQQQGQGQGQQMNQSSMGMQKQSSGMGMSSSQSSSGMNMSQGQGSSSMNMGSGQSSSGMNMGSGQSSSGMNMNQGQGSSSMNQRQSTWQQGQSGTGLVNQSDIDLCQDMLATEKYVSSTYDTSIFEFADTNVRKALNHIQKEEQQHGEAIYNYMKRKGAYNSN